MNKFIKRVDKLYKKTHSFLSYQDLCNIKEHCRMLLDENGVDPSDLVPKVNDFKKRMKAVLDTNGKNSEELYFLLVNENPNILTASHYSSAASDCERYPNGVWLKGKKREIQLYYAQVARKYLESKKQIVINP